MNEELREAIRELIRFAGDNPVATPEVLHARSVVIAYVEHGPLPLPRDEGYIPFNPKPSEIGVVWKPKKRR
jgi:hypothetical protein